jgi:hypothetical protein
MSAESVGPCRRFRCTGVGAHRSAVTKSSAVVGVVPGSERQAAQVRHLTEPSEQCGQEPFQDEAAIPA